MTEKTTQPITLRTPRAILSYPALFTPRVNDQSDDKTPKYSCTLLFDAEAQATAEYAAMRREANRVAIERFGQDQLKTLIEAGQFRNPFLNGDLKAATNPELAGKMYIRVSSKMKPGVVDRQRLPITDESKIYPGCFVFATLNCYAYPRPDARGAKTGNKGVSFGLRNIQFVADGTPLGGRTRPEDDFDALDADAFVDAQRGGGQTAESMF